VSDERAYRAHQLGQRLRSARESAGLSREQLVRSTGLSVETLRKIETGASKTPELYSVVAVAQVLGLDLNELCADFTSSSGSWEATQR
jgi:transcriptional regulator with XRE-family HTH domain